MNSITDLLHSENEYYDNQKVPGFVQGIVVENNNADFKGMVKVEDVYKRQAYPFKKYNYKVEIDGITEASFSEVSGFDASIDVIEYRTGDEGVNLSLIHI